MDEINQEQQDKLEQEYRRKNEQDRLKERSKKKRGPMDFKGKEADKLVDNTPLKHAPKTVQKGAKSLMTGHLLKEFGRFMQFLIISGAIIAACFGIINFLGKCFKEKPFFTVVVIVFWLGVVIALFILLLITIGVIACQSPIAKAFSWILGLFKEEFRICQILNDIVPDIQSSQPQIGTYADPGMMAF